MDNNWPVNCNSCKFQQLGNHTFFQILIGPGAFSKGLIWGLTLNSMDVFPSPNWKLFLETFQNYSDWLLHSALNFKYLQPNFHRFPKAFKISLNSTSSVNLVLLNNFLISISYLALFHSRTVVRHRPNKFQISGFGPQMLNLKHSYCMAWDNLARKKGKVAALWFKIQTIRNQF